MAQEETLSARALAAHEAAGLRRNHSARGRNGSGLDMSPELRLVHSSARGAGIPESEIEALIAAAKTHPA